jgi:hypothetical protein
MSVHEVDDCRLIVNGRVLTVPKPPRIHRLRVDSRRNSTCGSARLDDLDWSEWWTGTGLSGKMFILHVRHKEMRDTSHRVYCRTSDTPRLAFRGGVLYWLVSEEEETKAKETQR